MTDSDLERFPRVENEPKILAAAAAALRVQSQHRVASFRGRPMLLLQSPYPHFVPLHKDRFDTIAYPLLGGVSRSKMGDAFAYLSHTAQDLTEFDHLILFGRTDIAQPTENGDVLDVIPTVWDMRDLRTVPGADPELAIWRSPYAKLPTPKDAPDDGRVPFVLSLAGGDTGLYDDIMQSLAPMVMERKPDGVIWWVGDGANGKSTLMDAIYRIFPGQLSSITVKRLTDGRDTPGLNGTLANVVKESSEGRIDDTEVYKSIGTHENFRVHKFHSQDDIEIRGNIHHIFSGNSIPAFNDKGYSATRRTFVIPFKQRFKSDPLFEQNTFTPEMFGRLIMEMCKYANQLKRQGYRYKWSAATLAAKADYDIEANSADQYGKSIIEDGVVAFDSFNPVRMDYENWCADHGYVPLGVGNMRRALQGLGFERMSAKEGEHVKKNYRLSSVDQADLKPLGMGRIGLYTTDGFPPVDKAAVPEFREANEDGWKETVTPPKPIKTKDEGW